MSPLAAVADTRKTFPTVKEMSAWMYDALRGRDYGAVIEYPEIRSILTRDPQSDRGARAAVLRSGRRLLVDDQKLLVNRINIGYEIVRPEAHTEQSKRTRRGAIRRLQKSALMMTHAAFELIESEKDRQAFVQEQVRSTLALALTRRVSRRRVLPAKEQIALPSGAALVRMLTKK